MSFSSKVRDELAEKTGKARHCLLAELAAMSLFSGKFIKNQDKWQFFLETDRPGIRAKYFTLLLRTLNIKDVGDEYLSAAATESLMTATHLAPGPDGLPVLSDLVIIMQECCRKSFLRGAFLVSGSVSDPDRSYHFEIAAKDPDSAALLTGLIRDFGCDAKTVQRKNRYVVYLKDGADVGELMALMGASQSFLTFENDRVVREVRGNVNRKVNCETANIEKTVSAAVRQLSDIRLIDETGGLNSLPENLREIAALRLSHPDMSLTELGKLTHPPIGKSGVNHRLRRISEIAENLHSSRES
ncbi:MAG: DNA-binding protein WhiA [Lachnospiraceae bacterium]|nr:DNA-binding protein WhiA [Lachnospiraceae bacterium]